MQSAAINGHRIAISAVAFGASRPFLVVVGRAVLVVGKGELVPDVDGRLAGRLVGRLDAPHRANTPFIRTCAARPHKVPVDGVVSGAHTRLGRRRRRRRRRRPRWWRRWRGWRQWRSEAREAPEGMLTTQQAHLHIRMMTRYQPSSVGQPNASISLSSNNQWAISKFQLMREVIICNQWPSVGDQQAPGEVQAYLHIGKTREGAGLPRRHRRRNGSPPGMQRSSKVINDHQRSSKVIKGHQRLATWDVKAVRGARLGPLGCECPQKVR